MDVTLTSYDGPPKVTIIRAAGIFDASATEDFMVPTRKAIESGTENILLDLCEVSFMSSIGIRVINAIYFELHPRESKQKDKEIALKVRDGNYKAPHLKILSPQQNVVKVMKMVGIDQYIEIFEDEDQALAAFNDN